MSNAVATSKKNGAVARPIKVMLPLMRRELKLGFEAGQRHWLAFGRMLNEVRGHWEHDNSKVGGLTFREWVRESFVHPMSGEPLGESTVSDWMRGARRIGSTHAGAPARASVTAVVDPRSPKNEDYKPNLDWKASVRKVQQSINVEAMARQMDDEVAEEREMRSLAQKIITAGYRALSAIVHPDKPGGSTAAMQKLTKARKWLEEAIEA